MYNVLQGLMLIQYPFLRWLNTIITEKPTFLLDTRNNGLILIRTLLKSTLDRKMTSSSSRSWSQYGLALIPQSSPISKLHSESEAIFGGRLRWAEIAIRSTV